MLLHKPFLFCYGTLQDTLLSIRELPHTSKNIMHLSCTRLFYVFQLQGQFYFMSDSMLVISSQMKSLWLELLAGITVELIGSHDRSQPVLHKELLYIEFVSVNISVPILH